jgi:hypothetical protein
LVGGQGFAVDASLISCGCSEAELEQPRGLGAREIDPETPHALCVSISTRWMMKPSARRPRAKPKFTAHADPASQWTAARKGPAFFAYSDNYLIDTDHGIIVDVDASRSNKTAEVGAMRKMLDRTEERFGVKPDWIAADTAYGSSDNLVWLALKRQILPFIPSSTRANGPTEPSRDPTSHGMMRTTGTSARAAKRCGIHGGPILIQNGMRQFGKPETIGH